MTLTDARIRRDADHDVREVAPRGLAHAQAPELHARLQLLDRGERGPLGVGRHAIHEDVDVAAHEPVGRDQDQRRDEERRDRVSLRASRRGRAGARAERQSSQRGRWRSGARSRRARGCGSGARHEARPSPDSRPRRSRSGRRRTRTRRGSRSARPRRRAPRATGTRCTGSRARGSPPPRARRGAPPCRARTGARVGRPPGDADREQRQQRRDEVGPGVDCLRDEAEAPAREPGGELQRDEHAGGDDRDECRAPLRAHARKATGAAPAQCPRFPDVPLSARMPVGQCWPHGPPQEVLSGARRWRSPASPGGSRAGQGSEVSTSGLGGSHRTGGRERPG